jgi:putative addiction module component (TIGR02574 family)
MIFGMKDDHPLRAPSSLCLNVPMMPDLSIVASTLPRYRQGKGEVAMSTPVGDLFRRASALDDKDRASLAGVLLESLEYEVDEAAEAAWREETEQRLAELDDGSVELTSWEDVKARLKKSAGGQHTD